MKLTRNTNRSIRAWVDAVLLQLDLVLCEYSYREAYTALKRCQRCNDTKADVIDYMTANRGCISKSEHDMLMSLLNINMGGLMEL